MDGLFFVGAHRLRQLGATDRTLGNDDVHGDKRRILKRLSEPLTYMKYLHNNTYTYSETKVISQISTLQIRVRHSILFGEDTAFFLSLREASGSREYET